jgi:hypothetical protein
MRPPTPIALRDEPRADGDNILALIRGMASLVRSYYALYGRCRLDLWAKTLE